jgi:hypothetical protein
MAFTVLTTKQCFVEICCTKFYPVGKNINNQIKLPLHVLSVVELSLH